MKTRWLTLALGILLLPIQPCEPQTAAPARALSPLEQTLMASEKSLIDARKKGGAEFFTQTFASDFLLVGVDGEVHDRQEAIDDWQDGGTDVMAYKMKVMPAGENAAIVTYDAIVHVPPEQDQGPPPRYQHISSVWDKQGDQWKLKFQQATATHWGDW